VFLDIFLNWVMIFGKLGMPALGLEGAAISTVISRTVSLGGMIWWCVRDQDMKEWVPQRWFRAPDWPAVKDLLRTGFPASMQLLAEVSAFVMATFIIGNMGKAALASHQVAITCAATIFMVPLGISMALTVRIGEAFGARNHGVMRTIVASGWAMGTLFTMFSASGFVLFNHEIASGFIKGERSTEVLDVAAALLVVAAAFQFCDSLQIISAGALRGLDDVHTPAWIAVWAYWVVSIPLGWVLAHPLGLGVTGMWWGITVGLTMTAILLGRRIWVKTGAAAHEYMAAPEPSPSDT
jgi:MATE family multidrug resistance protein